MIKSSLSSKATEVIFRDAVNRDLTTARRAALLDLLWNERFLTRAQLIARLDLKLGKNCFGKSAWEDNFYRDMRVVKQAFHAAGLHLAFSRSKQRSGYYLLDQPALSPELAQILKSSSAEVDQRQIDIYHQHSPADRFHQGCAISDTARNVVAYRIRQENPGLSPEEANLFALQRAYSEHTRHEYKAPGDRRVSHAGARRP
jgi:hypothetical protein